MVHILSGGTSTASMVLFDPASLPADFDILVNDDPAAAVETAEERGQLVCLPEDDGGYLLHLYVDEEVPPYLAGHLQPKVCQSTLVVTSGKLCYSGIEYVHREDDTLLRKSPAGGEWASIPAGQYRTTVRTAYYPKGTLEEELRARISRAGWVIFRLEQSLGDLMVIAFVALLGSLIVSLGSVWNYYALGAAVVTSAVLFLLHRLPLYKRVSGEWTAVQRKYPKFLVVLKRLGAKGK